MGGVHCFTSATYSYLSRARVLAESIKRYHPDWVLWLILSDKAPEDVSLESELCVFDQVVQVEDLSLDHIHGWIYRHDIVELCTAVKGHMLERIFESGADKVIYLDPDIALFAPLSTVVDRLTDSSVLLTPHLLEPEQSTLAVEDNEISALKHGVYNLGFVAVSNSFEGRRFARWWRDRLNSHCYDDVPGGLFTDQRWCDLAPALFRSVSILHDPGYNVASWNLSQRPLSVTEDGRILAAGSELRFYHFTKVNTVGEGMIERYSPDNIVPFELLQWYRRRLDDFDVPALPRDWWWYSRYEDGKKIPKQHRVIYRGRPDLIDRFPNPFKVGPGSFLNWLLENDAKANAG